MNIENDVWVLNESEISQTFETRESIQKPEGGLVEQVIKEEMPEDSRQNSTLVLRGDDVIRINSFPFLIGKSKKVDYTIDGDTYISRKHCRIIRRGDKYYVEDLDSMNGTFVDGQEISGKVEIHEGSEIILADRRYIARWED